MEKKTPYNFPLKYVALYAKHWYAREQEGRTIFDDLRICITADGYQAEFLSDLDILGLILSKCNDIDSRAFTDLCMFLDGISERECWKTGYYTTAHTWLREPSTEVYDINKATLYYCLSNLCVTDKTWLNITDWPHPYYNFGLPKNREDITQREINEILNPRIKFVDFEPVI